MMSSKHIFAAKPQYRLPVLRVSLCVLNPYCSLVVWTLLESGHFLITRTNLLVKSSVHTVDVRSLIEVHVSDILLKLYFTVFSCTLTITK